MDDKPLPQNIPMEESTLGAMLAHEPAIDVAASILVTSDFTKEPHQFIFDAIVDLNAAGQPVDKRLVADELRKRSHLSQVNATVKGLGPNEDYLDTLAITSNPYNVRHYAAKVKECSNLRRIIATCGKATNDAYRNNGTSAAGIVDSLETALSDTVVFQPQGHTAADLRDLDLPEPRMVVFRTIPKGLSMLVGKPKMGKSFLALQICVAVASGGQVLGEDVEQGTVLYLALEDTARRIKSRLSLMLQYDPTWPENLHLQYQCDHLDQGGFAQLRRWLKDHLDTRLIVIDTFAKVRQKPVGRGSSSSLYQEDYAATAGLKMLADETGCAILLVHHLRKGIADDVLDMVSGSTGLTGSADTVLVLQRDRSSADAELHVVGRDMEERELALQFDSTTLTWDVLGDASEYRGGQRRKQILDLLKDTDEDEALSPKDIADATGISYGLVKRLMPEMRRDGLVVSPERGRYTHSPSSSTPSTKEKDNNKEDGLFE